MQERAISEGRGAFALLLYLYIRNGRARTKKIKKMQKNAKKMPKNLVMSKKSSTFAPAFEK